MVTLPSDAMPEERGPDNLGWECQRVARHAALAARAEVRKLLRDEPRTATSEDLRALGDEALGALLEHTDIPVSRRQFTRMRELVRADVEDLVKDGLPSPVSVNLIMPDDKRAWEIEIAVDTLGWGCMRDLMTPDERAAGFEWKPRYLRNPPPLAEKLIQATLRLCQQDVTEIARQCEAELAECDSLDEFWDCCSDELVTDKLTTITKEKVARLITRHPGITFEDAIACWNNETCDGYEKFDQLEPVHAQDETAFRLILPIATYVAYQARCILEPAVFNVLKAKPGVGRTATAGGDGPQQP